MRIEFLTEDDAEAVAELAAENYPDTYPVSVADIRDNLRSTDFASFYLGVRDGRRLVGYFMAWIDNTLVEGRKERVALIDDVVLEPRARTKLYSLIAKMIASMKNRGMGMLPIEGSSRPEAVQTLFDHPAAIERLGYSLTTYSEYYDSTFQENLTWVRYDAIVEEVVGINQQDAVEFGTQDDVYWQ